MQKKSLKSRFAPTPSGFLHQGNGFNFILTYLLTKLDNGSIHLRIDDYDKARCRDEFINDIFETLEWLELDWDSGPRNLKDFKQNYSSQLRLEQYQNYLKKIKNTFVCECSRKDLLIFKDLKKYPGTCYKKNLSYKSTSNCIKFKSHDQNDFILWTKENLPSYQLASFVDDIELGINLIVRGKDLLESTQFQLKIADDLNQDSFKEIHFVHHDLVVDNHNVKLSKGQNSKSLKNRRESGVTKEEFYKEFCLFMGLDISHTFTLNNMKAALLKTNYELI